MKHYLADILNVEQLVDGLRDETEKFWFPKENPVVADTFKKQRFYFLIPTQRYFWDKLNDLTKLFDFFGIEHFDINKTNMENWMETLTNPFSFAGDLRTNLELAFDGIKSVFRTAKTELSEKISLLEDEEKKRLNEAFNCYVQELNYSAIVMSVSAIENKLFSLMMLKCCDKKLEDLTLGQLIREYTDHKEKYSNIIPEKHEPLLTYCNTYRVFSVHPKKERITRAIATSILCMSCSFLFDEDLKKPTENKG